MVSFCVTDFFFSELLLGCSGLWPGIQGTNGQTFWPLQGIEVWRGPSATILEGEITLQADRSGSRPAGVIPQVAARYVLTEMGTSGRDLAWILGWAAAQL